ncbi:winged helix-turn-helix domain-containing protein [Variovorax sp. dw_308]|uniref:winged helix-turn-helix domain-containing protein n=1 Tax=Variovorax sp. dw_308 TaxID=2721546 RepID=UPI001C45B03C|nr:winged helix-turn-helix domain-containing protein [Variovorax sp. dw_308]
MNDEPSTIKERIPQTIASLRARAEVVASVRFADFEFDFQRDELRRDGVLIPLRPKPGALLRYLLANPRRLVSKSELMEHLWGDVVVTDDSLVQCVGELRSRMGDQGPKLITTHPRRGYRFEAEVRSCSPEEPGLAPDTADPGAAANTSPATITRVPPRRTWRGAGLTLALGVFAIAGGAVYLRPATAPTTYRIDDEIARRYSLVVMPFRDGTASAPKAVREGMVDEIASLMTQRQNAIVIRSASPVGARYAMSGTVSANGAGIVVSVQVKSVADGTIVWSEHYDYPDRNDPRINLDVAMRTAGGLRLRQLELHKARVSAPGYRFDPADLTLSGWEDIDRRQTAQDVSRGKARFEEALKADPESVLALTGLGAALMSERFGASGEPAPRDVAESERVAAKAINIAPNDTVALINWANVLLFRGQPTLALPFYEKAVLRAPSNPNAHLRYATILLIVGRSGETQSQIEDAMRIGHRDPRNMANAYFVASNVAFVAGDDEKAYALALRSLAERPTFGSSYAILASIDALHGRSAQAAKNMAEHRRVMPYSTIERYVINNPSGSDSYLASRNRMVEGLRAAGLPEHLSMN